MLVKTNKPNMSFFSIKVVNPVEYYLQVEAEDFAQAKDIVMLRLHDGEYDECKSGKMSIAEVKEGKLVTTFPEALTVIEM